MKVGTRVSLHRPSRLIVVGALVAAILTWVVQVVAARMLGPAEFAFFMAMWSVVFVELAVLQGVHQQLVLDLIQRTNGNAASAPPAGSRVNTWLLMQAGVTSLILVAALWQIVRGQDVLLITTILGAALLCLPLFIGQQVLNGVLVASRSWRLYATSLTIEAAFRMFIVVGALALGVSMSGQVTAIALGAMGWLLLMLWPAVQERVRAVSLGRVRRSIGRASPAIVATAASGVFVTGFPALATAFSDLRPSSLGSCIAAVVLTRAPLLLPLSALQGSLITTYSANARDGGRFLIRNLQLLIALSSLGVLATFALGEPVLALIFGSEFVVTSLVFAGLAVGAGLTAALTLIGWFVLAQIGRSAYAACWTVCLVSTCIALTMASTNEGLTAALIVGPTTGIVTAIARIRMHLGATA